MRYVPFWCPWEPPPPLYSLFLAHGALTSKEKCRKSAVILRGRSFPFPGICSRIVAHIYKSAVNFIILPSSPIPLFCVFMSFPLSIFPPNFPFPDVSVGCCCCCAIPLSAQSISTVIWSMSLSSPPTFGMHAFPPLVCPFCSAAYAFKRLGAIRCFLGWEERKN